MFNVIGEGTFGKVVECWDREEKKYVAIKIIRAIEKYTDAAKIEIQILDNLKAHDKLEELPIIQLRSWFEHKGHICMVFEIYGLSLYDFLKKNKYRGFVLEQTRSFAKQIFTAVSFMHDLTLIHTDLKPENILLENSSYTISKDSNKRIPDSTDIKLIDFGSATFESDYHTTVVSTRHYRAPEVILGLGWSYPCDVWSVGCILVELYTGDALFQTHENREHLAMMEKAFGPMPEHIVKTADKHSQKYFDGHSGNVIWPDHGDERASFTRHVNRVKSLRELIPHDDLYDLVSKSLAYDPAQRLTSKEALSHPFFKLYEPE